MSRDGRSKAGLLPPALGAIFLVVAVACGAAATATPTSPPPTNTTAPDTSMDEPTPTSQTGEEVEGARATNTPVPTPTSVSAQEPDGEVQAGGVVNMSAYADTRNWDPLGSASLSSVQALSQLYNQVVQFDTQDTTQVVGDLAADWEVSNGGQTFTFNLHENVQWHDGEDLTADDVVYSMERYMNPENSIGRSGLFRQYTKPAEEGGVRKVDDHTVEFNLAFPSGAFIKFLALDYAKVLPMHLLEQGIDLDQGQNVIQNNAGSGPFMLDEYQRGNSYKVSKNPNYFKEGRPYFDGINHFIITDTSTLKAQFQAGQIDMMNGGFSNLSPQEYVELDQSTMDSPNGHVIAHELPPSRNWGLMMNVQKEPFDDIRVRKAIYLALDRQQLNSLLENDTGGVPCPLGGMGHSFEECAEWPGNRPKDTPGGQADLEEAQRLMEEAGYPNGFDTSFDARQVGNYPDTCTVIKQQLQDTLGIDGQIQTHESAAGYSLYQTARPEGQEGDWELACQGEGMTVLDADALLGGVYIPGATRNYTDWSHPFIAERFEQQKVEQDPQARQEILKEMEEFLVPTNPDDLSQGFEDNHWVTLFWGKFFWLVHEDIRGFNPPQTVQYGFKHEDLWLDR